VANRNGETQLQQFTINNWSLQKINTKNSRWKNPKFKIQNWRYQLLLPGFFFQLFSYKKFDDVLPKIAKLFRCKLGKKKFSIFLWKKSLVMTSFGWDWVFDLLLGTHPGGSKTQPQAQPKKTQGRPQIGVLGCFGLGLGLRCRYRIWAIGYKDLDPQNAYKR